MEGNLKWKLALLLLSFLHTAAAQPVECDGIAFNCSDGQYCDLPVHKCRKCIDCAEFNRSPPLDGSKRCITSVVDCGHCFDGLSEDVKGLQCVSAPVSPAYVWVAIALGGLLLFVAAVAIVVYVFRNTDTFRVFTSATSLQPSCVPPATAPESPPPYNTLYAPVRPESPPSPPHLPDEGAASPFLKRPPPTPARESAGNQEANVYNNPSYVRGPHLPNNRHTAEYESEPEYLHDENTAESPWRPDVVNNNSNSNNNNNANKEPESGSSSSGSSSSAGTTSAATSSSLSAQLAAARAATLVRAPCTDVVPSKVPRLRQDTNNNRNNRDRDDDDTTPRGAGPTFNIHVNVQQVHDVKL